MRFTFIFFIAFMTAVVESGTVRIRGERRRSRKGRGISSGCGCLLFANLAVRRSLSAGSLLLGTEIRCRCMLCCAALRCVCRYYRPPRVQGPVCPLRMRVDVSVAVALLQK
jgi:hypothetical protein